jgi:hypothetical protein
VRHEFAHKLGAFTDVRVVTSTVLGICVSEPEMIYDDCFFTFLKRHWPSKFLAYNENYLTVRTIIILEGHV